MTCFGKECSRIFLFHDLPEYFPWSNGYSMISTLSPHLLWIFNQNISLLRPPVYLLCTLLLKRLAILFIHTRPQVFLLFWERVAELTDENLSEISPAVSSPFLIYRSMFITGKTERRNMSTYAFSLLHINILWYLQINSLSSPCSASHTNQLCKLFLWSLLPFAFFCKTLSIWHWSFSYKSPRSGVFLSCLTSLSGRPSVKPIMVLL